MQIQKYIMEEINLMIVNCLKLGMSQSDISRHFKKKGITPNSVSIIEKRLRSVKKDYGAKTLFHLAIILKSKKII